MKLPLPASRISRRFLLSTAAALPTISELVVTTAAKAQGPVGVLSSEQRAGETSDH